MVDFGEGRINLSVRIWVLEALADHLNLCPLHVISRLEAVCLQPAQLKSKSHWSAKGRFQEIEILGFPTDIRAVADWQLAASAVVAGNDLRWVESRHSVTCVCCCNLPRH